MQCQACRIRKAAHPPTNPSTHKTTAIFSFYPPDSVPGVRRPRDNVDAARSVSGAVKRDVRQELVAGGRGLRAEGGDDGGARGAVLDRNPHARALPRLGQDLF